MALVLSLHQVVLFLNDDGDSIVSIHSDNANDHADCESGISVSGNHNNVNDKIVVFSIETTMVWIVVVIMIVILIDKRY